MRDRAVPGSITIEVCGRADDSLNKAECELGFRTVSIRRCLNPLCWLETRQQLVDRCTDNHVGDDGRYVKGHDERNTKPYHQPCLFIWTKKAKVKEQECAFYQNSIGSIHA